MLELKPLILFLMTLMVITMTYDGGQTKAMMTIMVTVLPGDHDASFTLLVTKKNVETLNVTKPYRA